MRNFYYFQRGKMWLLFKGGFYLRKHSKCMPEIELLYEYQVTWQRNDKRENGFY